ncbi:MAG: 4-alpha-glucanotransferase [Pyrinomonadaceae bacterium]|nr:4-alpha-glucanotransferase [Pyrinomonadaceae bacterium]
MRFPRSSGILLHPTSLPGRYGIGELGLEAYSFVDALQQARQTLWQVLPLGPTGYGDSPYQSFSAFAGNTLLISLDLLVKEGLLTGEELEGAPAFAEDRVDFGGVIEFKNAQLERAYRCFKQSGSEHLRRAFEVFQSYAAAWLDDYGLFRAIKNHQDGKVWSEWDKELALRDNAAMKSAREELADEIEAQEFYQFLFFRQWAALKKYANQKGVSIVGDIPIFVSYDSADVWTHPQLFKLDKHGKPVVVAGVPPDYFSATGQLWGNPIYDWERMRQDGFSWWTERVSASFELMDILRIDHFRGFAAAWEIPAGHETAEHGKWVKVPGRELFSTLRKELGGNLPIIAENLGLITPDVESLRREFGFPGMRILQFGFSSDAENKFLPHNYEHEDVAYTGTHDNDTTVGWFNAEEGAGSTRTAAQIEKERAYSLKYLATDGREIHWDFIRAVFASVADIAIIPLQDVLGLGTEARMNLPASTSGNWDWRFRKGDLKSSMLARLAELSETYGRNMPAKTEAKDETGDAAMG